MKCIFCRARSDTSVSVEHIIPESLGNSQHILPAGIVCDSCNNYFALKIEKPLLESEYFVHTRFRNAIPNKRGRIPNLEIVYGPANTQLGLSRRNGMTSVYGCNDVDERRLVEYLQTSNVGHFIIPLAKPVDTHLVSRFLAKVALETVTDRVAKEPGWEEAVIFRKELDEIRHFARFGVKGKLWPYYERRIYAEGHRFTSDMGDDYEVLHELSLLYTDHCELYAIVAILGVEYAINLGGPEITGYLDWLAKNNWRSPLYQ